ncbi:MAG: hemerythrin family protein [Gammaproteobacteria bacterium]|nr:hemerythrin family protein [Gammaproteobacteria bacterium]MDH4315544.1 hemerythrin family protein [Gammaproteobacteria bacterium]MDH5215562.1 hemerythrin family protein [Gammaproteobacteria bacterium]
MKLLDWKSQYSVGVESVDFEHRQMIDLINELYTELSERRDPDSIEQFLGDIHSAISMHFALEERIMQEAGYEEFSAHKEDHEDLLDQIRNMMDVFADDTEAGFPELGKRLSDWFGAHFSTFDARLHGKLGAH